ncbi:MAG TPA: uroporphyrinogen-III synthase [Stellaceae bacterium]|nr:uroporphyrinogen-III synthase [Stellaceae bacterium]
MKVLVTRPEGEAQRLAATLAARGIESLIEPLIAIRFRPEGAEVLAPFLADAQAALFTSANGARAFAAATARRDFRIFAVGETTASTARDAGFTRIESAKGNVGELAARVIARLKPGDGALIHAAGSVTAGDLGDVLGAAGFTLRRTVLYEAVAAEGLSPALRDALRRRELAAALFFSPRTAAIFVHLAAGLETHCAPLVAVAFSPAVAAALEPLPWRRIAVASSPQEAELLRALERSLETEQSS